MRPPRAEAARLTAACAFMTVAIGLTVLAGWAFDLDDLQRLFVGRIHMLPITAFTFVIGGVSLWLQRAHERKPIAIVARSLAILVLAIGAITLVERVFAWDAGIDQVLFHDQLARLLDGQAQAEVRVRQLRAGVAVRALPGTLEHELAALRRGRIEAARRRSRRGER